MYRIIAKEELAKNIINMTIHAPFVAKKALAGQFVIVRASKHSERIPLTIADYDRDANTVKIIFQIAGQGTKELNYLGVDEYLEDIVGPLGKASETLKLNKAIVVGGGVGCAIALPILKALYQEGTETYSVVGFISKDMVILEEEFSIYSQEMILMTDDASYGHGGKVTEGLDILLNYHKDVDCVFVIGPLVMMKFVSELTQRYGVKTVISMNPIMVDGTGMCGGCRLTVGGETRFACVDGPEFDGHQVDFDEMIRRNRLYDKRSSNDDGSQIKRKTQESRNRQDHCNLFKEVSNVL